MSFVFLRDAVLFALAIYGAVLSTYNLVMARRKDRRAIAAGFDTVMATFPDGSLGPPYAKLSATNTGHRPVIVTSIALQLPNRSRIVPTSWNNFWHPDTDLPATLNDGETAHYYMSYLDIAHALEEQGHKKATVRTVCVDSTGGVHTGHPIEVDVAEFKKMST